MNDYDAIARGREETLDDIEKYVQERIDLMVKDARVNGGDSCTKARLRELNKVKDKINSMSEKQ